MCHQGCIVAGIAPTGSSCRAAPSGSQWRTDCSSLTHRDRPERFTSLSAGRPCFRARPVRLGKRGVPGSAHAGARRLANRSSLPVPCERRLARPTGFEPVAFGSGGRGKETTGGSAEPLPLILLAFCQTPDHPRPLRAATDCQSFVSHGSARSQHDCQRERDLASAVRFVLRHEAARCI